MSQDKNTFQWKDAYLSVVFLPYWKLSNDIYIWITKSNKRIGKYKWNTNNLNWSFLLPFVLFLRGKRHLKETTDWIEVKLLSNTKQMHFMLIGMYETIRFAHSTFQLREIEEFFNAEMKFYRNHISQLSVSFKQSIIALEVTVTELEVCQQVFMQWEERRYDIWQHFFWFIYK